MTTLLTRVAPSPVPLTQQEAPRDVSDNPWVQAPQLDELQALFAGVDWQVASPVSVHRRPSPGRHVD